MNRRRLIYAALSALLIAGFFLTQFRLRPDVRPLGGADDVLALAKRDDLNVVFLLVDTMRADRLGAYGYERPTSPTIDHLARTGIRFANHLAQSSWTKTSMASIWTATYPSRNGILRYDHAIPNSAVMPAEILKDSGYITAGIWRNGWVASTFGFEQGFEVYHRPNIGTPLAGVRRESDNPYAKLAGSDMDATDGVLEFLRANERDRFFLYVHFMDAHQYLSDEESAIFGTTYSDLYDNSIHWTDRQVARVLDGLEEYGLRDETIVVIASDHGEAFLEHGNEGHAKDLHREVIYTPWIVSLPFSLEQGVVVDAMTENVDIWPTLLDLLGEPALEDVDGISRVPEILSVLGNEAGPSNPERPSFAQLDRSWGKTEAESEPLISVTVAGRRFMRGFGTRPVVKLFDRSVDPLERENILAKSTDLDVSEYDALIESYRNAKKPAWAEEVGTVEIDDMQKGQLRALGYAIE